MFWLGVRSHVAFVLWLTILTSITSMANANISRQLRETELCRCCRNSAAGATFRNTALAVHHIVITRAWERYRLHGTFTRRHAGGRLWVTTQAQNLFFGRSECKVFDNVQLLFKMTVLILRESVFPRRRYVEGWRRVIIPPHKKVVRGVYWNQLVCPSGCPSVRRFFLVRPIT
jgi:hypothetical protein